MLLVSFSSPLTRVVSGTEGTDGDAFTALMTAVAARKPLMVFSLTLFEGKLLPEITLNSDTVKTNSESATLNDNFDNKTSLETVPTDVDEIAQRKPDIITPKKGTRNLCSLSDADGWDRECRLPNFSFSVHPGSSDRSAPDVDLTICTNIPPKANAPEDRCDRFPIHHTILKSMLQKAVRRRITESVIRLSLALAHVSTLELLRYSVISSIFIFIYSS